jgi:hypothetical protein
MECNHSDFAPSPRIDLSISLTPPGWVRTWHILSIITAVQPNVYGDSLWLLGLDNNRDDCLIDLIEATRVPRFRPPGAYPRIDRNS